MKRIITILVVAALLAVIVPAGLGCPKPSAEVATMPAQEVTAPAEVAETPSEFETSGTMEMIKSIVDPNPKIENFEWTGRVTDYWDVHGSLEGTYVIDYTMVADTTNGKFTIDGLGTFTGEVEGKSGSFIYDIVGSGQFTSPTAESGWCTTEDTIIRGTGELANLSGTSHSEYRSDNNIATATYSGTLKFE
jgi:hypothetical protein